MRKQYLAVTFPGTFTVLFILLLIGIDASCPERQFNNTKHCLPCPDHCVFCNSFDNCLSCDNGYSGTICRQVCVNCKQGSECLKHNGYCKEDCKDGLSGQYCNQTCDSRCHSCLRNNSSHCLTCKQNQTCILACPEVCLFRNCTGKICADDSCPDHCRFDTSKTSGKPSAGLEILVVPSVSILLIALVGVVLVLLHRKRRQCRQAETQTPSTKCEIVTDEDLMWSQSVRDASEGSTMTSESLAPAVASRTNKFRYMNDQFFRNKDLSYFSSLGQDTSLPHRYEPLDETTHSEIQKSHQCQSPKQKAIVSDTTGETGYEDTA